MQSGLFFFGFWQILINRRLKALQDFVAVSVVQGDRRLKVLNTGKLNLYIHKFEMPGNVQVFMKPRMVPTGAGDTSHYWLPLPAISSVKEGQNFSINIYLTDQYGKRYISDNGGILEDEKLTVWSHKTNQSDWLL